MSYVGRKGLGMPGRSQYKAVIGNNALDPIGPFYNLVKQTR